MTCQHNTCLGWASYSYKKNGFEKPFFFKTTDAGLTWHFINGMDDLFQDMSFVHFDNGTCSENTCVIYGNYGLIPTQKSFLLMTNNVGSSWKIVDINSLLPNHEGVHDFGSIIYNKGQFIFGSSYWTPNKIDQSFFIISDNDGATWEFNKHIKGENQETIIEDIRCNANVCIAFGLLVENKYYYGSGILISSDNGNTWQAQKNTVNLPTEAKSSHVNSVAYNKLNWIAAGDYTTEDDKHHPMLLVNQDNGYHWYAVPLKIEAPLNIGYLLAAQCDNTECNAIGYVGPGSDANAPLLLNSKDNGLTWNALSINTSLKFYNMTINSILGSTQIF